MRFATCVDGGMLGIVSCALTVPSRAKELMLTLTSKQSKETKPKPRELPVSGSRMILGVATITPNAANVSYSSCVHMRMHGTRTHEETYVDVLDVSATGRHGEMHANLQTVKAGWACCMQSSCTMLV